MAPVVVCFLQSDLSHLRFKMVCLTDIVQQTSGDGRLIESKVREIDQKVCGLRVHYEASENYAPADIVE